MKQDDILASGAETVSLFCRLYMNTKRDLPVRSSHMGLLILTVTSKDPVTPLSAAHFFQVKKPMITAMVQSLEKGGYLVRQPSSADKRSYSLVPTEKTVRLVNETYGEYLKAMNDLYQGMGEKKYRELVNLLAAANEVLLKGRE